ncbi:MAG: 6-phosphofructokinase [Sandaracinaceae bacterium]|nr:6-phosphofructokinase [Sandaracinaceae bacterium]
MTNALPFLRPSRAPRSDKRVLAIFDGGNAPGYSSVAVAITEEAARHGYELWAATEGFRSLTRDAQAELHFERLTVHRKERYQLLAAGIPARSMGRRVQDPGSDFRSERYVGFHDVERRREAAETFRQQGFTHVICVGGNGTLEGAKAWLDVFGDDRPAMGFINVSVDNDVAGDRAIGFLTGVEAGSTVARGLYEDAYTHKRTYLLEMMGNRSGRHALHCGVAARAHLVVLPFFHFPAAVLEDLARALAAAEMALVVVAEGYEQETRAALPDRPSASHWLKRQLEQFGLRDRAGKRVIAEPFSRYLRGVRPGFADVSAAYIKTSILFQAFERGQSEVMPYILGAHDVGLRPFSEIVREDRVERSFLPLLDRLGVPAFDEWVARNFTTDERTI